MKDRVALVTGAGRGIGRAIALSLARHGCTVVLTARDEGKLRKVDAEVESAGGKAMVHTVDLCEESSIRSLVAAVKNKTSRLDILVNCAGITHSGLLEETTTENWDSIMATNVRGPFLLCREALPLLKQSDKAAIINISSVVGIKGYPRQSAYTASKHALRGMSISLAEELRETKIRVHVICMGGVDTDMVSQVRPDIPKDALIAPEEIAELVEYLITHKGNAVIDEFHVRRSASAPWF